MNNSEKCEGAVIWDVDGTLVDTAELHFQAWCVLAREMGKPFTRGDFAGTFGWRNPEIIPKLFGAHYTPQEVDELGGRKEDLYRQEASKGVALLPGVCSLLEGLQRAGFRQAIGSSAPRANLELILDLTGTVSFFTAVVAMEDTRRGKPDPDVFLQGAAKLGVGPGRCLVFEDAPVGVQAAKAGGMKCVGVTFVGHHSEQALRQAGADLVVPTLESVDAAQVQKLFVQPGLKTGTHFVMPRSALQILNETVIACRRCPRLVDWREQVAREKRSAFRHEDYWGRPITGFGDPKARVLVCGLAPAAHGGNRTGRVFTGDRSGDFLFAALHRAGFANQPTSTHRDDGLRLWDCYITACVRCAPPANKPTPSERDTCLEYLQTELPLLKNLCVIVCLGKFAWEGVLKTLGDMGHPSKPKPKFGHGSPAMVGPYHLLGCYHPSQQNTFTGRLTEEMLDRVLKRARELAVTASRM